MDGRMIGVVLVLIAVFLEAGVQLALKKSSLGESAKRWLTVGVLCFALNAVVWTFVLRWLDVSVAYPLSSLGYVVVVILSKLMLNETVTGKRWAGVCFILCGTALVGLGGG